MQSVLDINWNEGLDAQENNLLLLIAQGDELQRWDLVKELIIRVDGDGKLIFNVNYKNQQGDSSERLIDKAKYLMDIASLDINKQALVVQMQEMIIALRNQGSVEPREFIIKDNLMLNKDQMETAQNYQALPKLREKLHAKYNLNQNQITDAVNDLKVAMEVYITQNWQSQEDRKLMREGDNEVSVTGLITEANRLINLGQQHKNAQGINLNWIPKTELAYLWTCAKANGCEIKFMEVFSGLNACEWGRLVNLYIPLTKAIMGHGNDATDYTKIVNDISPVVQQEVVDVLLNKFADNKPQVTKIIVDAFLDFMECRNELGGIIPEQWKMETQMVIGMFNQVFTQNMSKFLNKPMNGLIESYHYQQFNQYVITAIISEPELYKGIMTNIFIDEKILISDNLLKALLAQKEGNPIDIIAEFQEQHELMLDLQFIPAENMFKFYDNLEAKRLSVLKAFNSSKLKVNIDFEKFMQKELTVTKIKEFKLATEAQLDGNNSLLKNFGAAWVLDKETFNTIVDQLNTEEVQLLLPKINYCKQTQETTVLSKEILTKAKAVNSEKLINQVVENLEDADKIINEFIGKFGAMDLRVCVVDQIMQLLNTNNEALVHRLATDENIMIDWVAVIDQNKHTLLSYFSHMEEGKYALDAIEVYKHNAEDWQQTISHNIVEMGGKVDGQFGDVI
ncbi:hypothetical protein [Candidatus Trichorickettsia mobilis]|uniref:hypothetical protein n=1 Tax=Candidatus Trichorickettsia mobilis TaxID=1346319 RepID=UPI00292E0B20|nr:hypothetical protein [Candidatus Trichorickettsia mobilis]